ncbi:MAG TPA: ABC transporter permease [Caldilineaceae bacterium]|nr:ABC transporter permease [Caldilineaceae bacterium]
MMTIQQATLQTQLGESRQTQRANSWWGDAWRRFSRQKLGVAAAILFLTLVLLAILAPVLAPYDPLEQFRKEGLTAQGQPLPPNSQFWLGTDGLGRDVLSRLLYGGRFSLGIAITASAITVLIGLLVGGEAGFLGGKSDFFVMRFVDLVMSMPTFFLTLLLVVMLSPGVWVVITVIALFAWTGPARVFRSQVLTVKRRDFIQAADCLSVRRQRVFLRHLLPHVLPLIAVYMALGIPNAVFAEASLSFLGLGVPAPLPSWGSMIRDGYEYYRAAPWIAFFPGAAIALAVVSINLLGNALRDAMDPMRKR